MPGSGPPFPHPYLSAGPARDIRYRSYDVLVVGGGVGGLTAAMGAAATRSVGLLTKAGFDETATFFAQGGIAAALAPYDSPELHLRDTLAAGAGLCDEAAVKVLVQEGPDRVYRLERLGTKFDKLDGQLILASEGAHSVPRIVHAGGDATGSVVEGALVDAMVAGRRVALHEDEFVVDLIMRGGRAVGALSLGPDGRFTASFARAVVLATGGVGQLFANTTNPPAATGDGHAMAYRAGAWLRDMEFMQFHPTAFHCSENPALLVTEALRGAGAYLRDIHGERFMLGVHPQAELAPRDVAVRRMKEVMDRDRVDHVLLDARHLACPELMVEFPTVTQGLKARGVDLCTELVPVSPASHYFIGGVITDLWGRTSLPGLWACGEVASTGVHGANRLASNSLLEGLVFGERVVQDIERSFQAPGLLDPPEPVLSLPEAGMSGNSRDTVEAARRRLALTMSRFCGIVRSEAALQDARRIVGELRDSLRPARAQVAELELVNLLTLAELVIESALRRQESRGVHLRSDYPERDDRWRKNLAVRRENGGEPSFRVLQRGERPDD